MTTHTRLCSMLSVANPTTRYVPGDEGEGAQGDGAGQLRAEKEAAEKEAATLKIKLDAERQRVKQLQSAEAKAEAARKHSLGQVLMKELRGRAEQAGYDKEDIEMVLRAKNPKEALICLLDRPPRKEATKKGNAKPTKDELASLKTSELRARVVNAKVPKDRVEEALHSPNPKSAMIELALSVL
eukprot:SAG31_NODE_498_length_14861_cov_3.405026_11_plen_184_part_00